MNTRALIQAYYEAFNDDDTEAMAAMVTENVAHDVNQGSRRTGKSAFREFNAKMRRCYAERLTDIVIMVDESGTRAAAEFVVNGFYIATDEGLPEAENQKYRLPAGTFFEVEEGSIARVSTYYNLTDWTAQVSG